MIALLLHEAQILTRRAIWPVAVTLHAIATAAFVGIWGPTGGVPLWDASVLHQLTAADRILGAVLITWLSTYALSDDDARGLLDWSALTGRPVKSVYGARLAVAAVLGVIFTIVAVPAFAAAGEASAATRGDVAAQIGAAIGFALLCVGVTAVANVAVEDRVGVWCTAMALSLIAAVAIQIIDQTWLRIAAPLAAGIALMTMAAAGIRARRAGRG